MRTARHDSPASAASPLELDWVDCCSAAGVSGVRSAAVGAVAAVRGVLG